jgi:RNA polymerase sigma-70 factor (ECF subfamily)
LGSRRSPVPPADSTTTTTLLLQSLRDTNNEHVWREFDARYRSIIIGFARNLGLNEEDASEVAQQTLTEFVRDFTNGKYQRERGRLRSWIIGIAHHRIADLCRNRARRRPARGESAMVDLSDAATLTQSWELAQQRAIFEKALNELRENTRMAKTTIQAFEMVAIRNVPPEVVAQECGISTAEVYVAKTRVTSKLREIVARLSEQYAEDA